MSDRKLSNINRTFRAALVWILEQKGRGEQSRLARKTNINPGYLSSIVNGKPASNEASETISKYFGYSYAEMLTLGQWIIDGKNPKDWTPSNQDSELSNVSPGPSLAHAHKIPIISWVQAGDWQDIFDPYQPGYAASCLLISA